ncbi:MAG TPA: hypothetical protein VGZ26_00580 [Pirellulales bacterium]|jgi:hypothetical protein|nr:hypothetical protein [Pirellulales bacterium]
MARLGEGDRIDDSEDIFRRIPKSMRWFNPDTKTVSPEAFNPRDEDVTGLSVYRAKYRTIEEAGQGQSRHGYYVAILNAGRLRAAGIEIRTDDLDDPGHAILSGLRADNRDSDEVLEWKEKLATQLVVNVQGPFGVHT